jgi:hypothetical protein
MKLTYTSLPPHQENIEALRRKLQGMRATEYNDRSELHAKERLSSGNPVGLSGIKGLNAIFIRHCILVRNR